MNTSTQITIAGSDLALLIFRSSIGITIAAHGWNKIFGGGRIKGTSRWFQSIGMKPGTFNAWMAALSEILCGLLLCLGFLTSFAAAGIIGIMVVAGWTVHRNNGFFIINDHSIDTKLIEKVFSVAEDIFKLPYETKYKYQVQTNTTNRKHMKHMRSTGNSCVHTGADATSALVDAWAPVCTGSLNSD